jgi:hypothetical protein
MEIPWPSIAMPTWGRTRLLERAPGTVRCSQRTAAAPRAIDSKLTALFSAQLLESDGRTSRPAAASTAMT